VDVGEHVKAFNAAVLNGDWDAFALRFAEDAVLEFVGPPVGPFVGRAAIAAAYRSSPPDDTIELMGPVREAGDEVIAPYRWDRTHQLGTMRFTESSGLISRLVVTFE
jgi:steroid Delta-isomerase